MRGRAGCPPNIGFYVSTFVRSQFSIAWRFFLMAIHFLKCDWIMTVCSMLIPP
jgi:hypothetical protein